jgi:hypothetical protein
LHNNSAVSRRISSFVMLPIALFAMATTACRTHEQIATSHNQSLTSLRATTVAIGNAWLSGAASGTYALTALSATQQLLADQRAQLAESAELLADARLAALDESEQQLAQIVALLWKAVREGDSDLARRQLNVVTSPRRDAP